MNQGEYLSDSELGMAIAAAAYAISSQEGDSTQKKRISFTGPETSLPRTETRSEDSKINRTTMGGSFKRWFTVKETKEDEESADKVSGESFTRQQITAEQTAIADSDINRKIAQKAMGSTPRVNKKPTLTENSHNDTGRKTVGSGNEMKPDSSAPSAKKPAMSPFDNKLDDNLGRKSIAETEADAWEKAKMAKIQNKHEQMISTIVECEKEKKAKAKRRLELKENGPEHKRASALQKYEEEISRIDKVAGDARAIAEDRKRNGEAKTREKARQIRLTGKIPHRHCCF